MDQIRTISKARSLINMEFATFWSGPLSPMEISCLLSFVDHGHKITVYSFDNHDLPSGVSRRDAGDILASAYLDKFITDGEPNVAHFADLFRLVMFQKTGEIWVDCDILLLDWGETAFPGEIIAQRADGGFINCALSIKNQLLLEQVISNTMKFVNRNVPWGAMQTVIPDALRKTGAKINPVHETLFCPIDHWYKLLLPSYHDECTAACAGATMLHLYNNVLQNVGYLKSALPPRESYLRKVLDERGYAFRFSGEYDVATIEALRRGWDLRFSGQAIGIGALGRQILPSLRRTIARRRP